MKVREARQVADGVVELRFLWHTAKKIINRCHKKEAAEGCGRGRRPTIMTGTHPLVAQQNVIVPGVVVDAGERATAHLYFLQRIWAI